MKRFLGTKIGIALSIATGWFASGEASANEGDLTVVIENIQNIQLRRFFRGSPEWLDRCIPDPGENGTFYRVLPFDFKARNIGNADVVAGQVPANLCTTCPCDAGSTAVRNGAYEWSPSHCHWHIKDFNNYTLVRPNTSEVRKGNKQAFCLLDSFKWNLNSTASGKYGCTNQGVSVGWEDVYGWSLPCQFLIIDNVTTGETLPDGDYRIVATTNAAPNLTEANIHNNSVAVPIRKTGDTVTAIGGAWQARQTVTAAGTDTKFPKLVSWGPNRLDSLWVDSTGRLRHTFKGPTSNGAWSTVADRGAPAGVTLSTDESALAVTSWAPGRIDVAVRGSDNRLWHTWFGNGTWAGWDNPGSASNVFGNVALNSWGPDRLDFFWTDGPGNLLHIAWAGTFFGGIDALGNPGASFGSTSVVSWERNRLDIFGRAGTGLWHKWWGGNGWSGWENTGGVADVKSVRAVSWAPGRLDVFWNSNTVNAIKHIAYEGQWFGVDTLTPPAGVNVQWNSLSAVAWGHNRLDVFTRTGTSRMYHLYWHGSGWGWHSPYTDTDMSSSPFVNSWAGNELNVVFGTSNGNVATHSYL